MTITDNNIKQLLDNYFIKENIPFANSIQTSLLQIQQTKDVSQYKGLMSKLLESPNEVNNKEAIFPVLLSTTLLLGKAIDFLDLMIQLKNDSMIKELFTQMPICNEGTLYEEYEEALFLLKDYLLTNTDLVCIYLNYSIDSNSCQLYPVFSLLLQHFTRNSMTSEVSMLIHYMILNEIEISTCAINSSIDFYCRMNQLEEAQKFFRKMSDYKPSKLFQCTELKFKKYQLGTGVNIVTYGTFIKWLCKTNHLDLAMYYYQFLKERDMLKDEIVYNLLIDGCAKCGNIQSLKELYFDMLNNSIKPSIITFNTIIDAYIRTKDLQSAWRIYDDLIKNNIQPDNFTLSNLFKGIRLPCHKDYFNRAVSIIKALPSFTDLNIDHQNQEQVQEDQEQKQKGKEKGVDIILINVLLDSCIAMKESKLLIELFQDVINERMPNITPDIITYNTFIKGCAQMNLSDQVIIAYESLCFNSLKFNVYPNDVTFNTLIDVFVRSGNMKQVWMIIAKMKSLNIKPDNFTYSTIIKSLNKNTNLSITEDSASSQSESELDLAFKLFENVKKSAQPDEILYNCIMDACLRFNQIDKMLELYDTMQLERIKPSSITCGIAIKAYGMKGNLNKALEIYAQMKEENIDISSITYGCLINACIQNNNLFKAFELYEDLQRTGYEMNTILYTTLIKAYAKTKDIAKVLDILTKMKNSLCSQPNNVTYNSVIDCCIKVADFTKANEIFEEMRFKQKEKENSDVHPDIITFSTLIKGVLKKGDFESAMYYYNIMIQTSKIKPDEVLLNSLLDGCDKCHKYTRAIELFETVKSFGVEPTMMSYSIMMKLLGKLNDYQYSKNLLDEILKKNKNVSLIMFTCFIRTCFNNKETITAINTFYSLAKYKLYPDTIAFNTMINGITSSTYEKRLCDDLCKIIYSSVDANIILQRHCYISVLKYLKGCKLFDKANEMSKYLEKHNRLEPRKNNNFNYNNNNNNKQYIYSSVYHDNDNVNINITDSKSNGIIITQIQQQKNATNDRKPLAQLKDYSKNYNAETGNNYEQLKKYDENNNNSYIYSFENSSSGKGNNQQYQLQPQQQQQQQEGNIYDKKKKPYQKINSHVYNYFDNNPHHHNTFQPQIPLSSSINQQDKPKKKFNRF